MFSTFTSRLKSSAARLRDRCAPPWQRLQGAFARALPDSTVADHDFSPPLLRLQDTPPSPLGRKVLWALLLMLLALLVWALLGKLDIVAVAEGKLIPKSYLKIVQPAEAGIVKDILVREGDVVQPGQVLMRMDTLISEAEVGRQPQSPTG